ncbi:hypothetical protein B0H67DRAFT_579991 [Lasiosphaeris hirsuta]|uniref:Uncharacterized protein n=1 Tax=Lasiosphaeris hirsuta TaxID=260670 RepID=A0AA40AFY5_9PEZI|nr:hypothetical protein B0H67DRAFT_579991 [Lasiosphaeris hirsuta]
MASCHRNIDTGLMAIVQEAARRFSYYRKIANAPQGVHASEFFDFEVCLFVVTMALLLGFAWALCTLSCRELLTGYRYIIYPPKDHLAGWDADDDGISDIITLVSLAFGPVVLAAHGIIIIIIRAYGKEKVFSRFWRREESASYCDEKGPWLADEKECVGVELEASPIPKTGVPV